MEQLKDTLQKVFAGLTKAKICGSHDPDALFKQLFSKKEIKHVRFLAVRNEMMYIIVDCSTWLYYFNLQKKDLLGKLCSLTSGIKDIRFVLGETQGKNRTWQKKK